MGKVEKVYWLELGNWQIWTNDDDDNEQKNVDWEFHELTIIWQNVNVKMRKQVVVVDAVAESSTWTNRIHQVIVINVIPFTTGCSLSTAYSIFLSKETVWFSLTIKMSSKCTFEIRIKTMRQYQKNCLLEQLIW